MPVTHTVERDESDFLSMTPEQRGDARVSRQQRRIGELETEEPLRRPILKALVDKMPSWPRTDLIRGMVSEELAQQLGVSLEEVEHELGIMQDGGLIVEWERDGEGRAAGEWLLTDYGVSELSKHRAFGAREPLPPPPTEAQFVALIRIGLENALRMRGDAEWCEDAPERLWIVLTQAVEMGERGVADAARIELASCAFSPPRPLYDTL